MSDSDDESMDSPHANPSHMDLSSEEEEEEEEPVSLTPAEHKALGNESYKKGDYRAAIDHYTRAIEAQRIVLSSASGEKAPAALLLGSFFSNRSAAHMMILQHKQSIADCESALSLDPTLNKIRLRMAKQLVTVGRVEDGVECYRTALVSDPNNAAALKEKDQALMIQRRFALASECMAKFKATGQRIEGRQALAQLDVCLGVSPQWMKAKMLKCEALVAAGKGDEAYSLTSSLMRSGVMNSEILLIRASCLFTLGQLDDSIKHYKQVLSGDPDNTEAREGWKKVKALKAKKEEGDAFYRSADYKSAISSYSVALDLASSNPSMAAKIHNNRATSHANLRDHAACVADCTEAVRLDPTYAKAYMRRATSRMVMGEKEDIEEAIRDYEAYGRLKGDEAAREVQGKVRAAKVQLKRASRKDFYKILAVPKDATEAEIKKAYRKLALKHHPDRHATSTAEEKKESERVFRDVNLAYEVLSDPKKKQLYDDGVDEQDLDSEHAGHRGGGHGGFSQN
eukprot:CAMPEP_0182456082 /NCGR_PEP_ID=MMETSP1319-20130603/2026_1 /TAXON_ID=172717 /ORGANISM="Bolidomonas pacifica, Strain RCC208" /LENGTH=511 /DNA_ID=CAMNT_0024654257 /DNA_START=121 /DNA_END=1653 /DNA_ORIENTATION=+